MSNIIRTISSLTNLIDGNPSFGAIPQTTEDVVTTLNRIHITAQVVGTAHELISAGDVANYAMCVLKNNHATAVVTIGVEVSSVFYPLVRIPAGETAKLSRLESLAGTFLKSTVASTSVIVSLYEIVPPA